MQAVSCRKDTSGVASKHLVERIQDTVLNTVKQTSLLPRLECQLRAVLAVVLEDLFELRGECRVANAEGDLVVGLERAVVEVRRADGAPLPVDHHHLLMEKTLVVLVDADAEFEHV